MKSIFNLGGLSPKLIALLILGGLSPFVRAADPYVGYIYPAGIQAGTTNRLVIGGQGLRGLQSIRISGEGVRVLDIEDVPNFPNPQSIQRRHLVRWLDRIAQGNLEEPPLPPNPHLEEWRSNRWWTVLNTLDAGKLEIVERGLFIPRNPLQATPSLQQRLLVTVAVDADAKPGARSLIAVNGRGLSAPRPFFVSHAPRFAEPRYVPPHRTQPDPVHVSARTGTVYLEGQIMPGETDTFRVSLAAGRPIAFTVTARELQPYIGDAVPGFFNPVVTLKDARGKVLATADDEQRFRPDPVLRFTPPKDGDYLLEIHDVLYRGRADFVYSVRVGPAKSRKIPAADGVIAKAGEIGRMTFTIDKPGPRVLEVTARRKGSPLDAVLTLRKEANGPILAQWDDMTNTVFTGTVPQGECDPIGTYTFTEAGTYVAEVTDRTRHGGPDYVWWLDIRKPQPGFRVYSMRSTLPLLRGQALKVGFRVIRTDGFTGDVTIEAPDCASISNNVITAGVDRVTAELKSIARDPIHMTPYTLYAQAVINGKTVRVPIIPCDEYEQAFAWKHLVPAESFLLRAQGGWKKPNPGWKKNSVPAWKRRQRQNEKKNGSAKQPNRPKTKRFQNP
ncbi:MAG: hypothetical protein MJ249_12325 [Kiritimatiellae bacterium]|nr:hypothetical protein [Kiritimatiellia bacterium]